MKRLLDGGDASHGALTELLGSAERCEPSPFAKRALKSRILRELEAGGHPRRLALRPALLGIGAVLLAATAAAAGYSMLAPQPTAPDEDSARVLPAPLLPPRKAASVAVPSAAVALPQPSEVDAVPAPASPSSSRRSGDRPRAGEDPTQVAEAVRALRKQGDAARAQALLDQYLKSNPRGALAEDALALSIEAAAARKDPRAADYARRYLTRYPNGRFRAVAERALAR